MTTFRLFGRPTALAAKACFPQRKSVKQSLLAIAMMALCQSSIAGDPCAVILCLSSGMAAPQQCASPIAEYFNIRVYGKKGRFNAAATASNRLSQIVDQCPSASQEYKDFVQSAFGTLEHYPFGYVSD